MHFFTNFDCFPRKGTLFLKCTFFTNFDCFPRKGTFFYSFFLFIRFQKSKKSVPLRGLFFSNLSDFKRIKKVYPYEENALFLLILTVFPRKGTLFFTLFSIYQISKE